MYKVKPELGFQLPTGYPFEPVQLFFVPSKVSFLCTYNVKKPTNTKETREKYKVCLSNNSCGKAKHLGNNILKFQ